MQTSALAEDPTQGFAISANRRSSVTCRVGAEEVDLIRSSRLFNAIRTHWGLAFGLAERNLVRRVHGVTNEFAVDFPLPAFASLETFFECVQTPTFERRRCRCVFCQNGT